MVFATYLIVPLIIALLWWIFSGKKITGRELLLQLGIQSLIAGVLTLVIWQLNTSNTEILNGRITGKYKDTVSCEHSYPCHCRQICTSSKKGISCHTHCDTCYLHSHDYDWVVRSDVGSFRIARLDAQGVLEPKRYTDVQIGEPASAEHYYTDYLKSQSGSLFHQEPSTNLQLSYPRVFDYYRVRHLLWLFPFSDGTTIDDNAWNTRLGLINKDLNPGLEVNLLVVLMPALPYTDHSSIDKAVELERDWNGGRKNDVIVVIGVAGKVIDTVYTIALGNEDLKVKMRNALLDQPLDIGVLDTMGGVVKASYHRKPMSDFNYLKARIQPTFSQWMVGLVISMAAAVGLSVFFVINEVL